MAEHEVEVPQPIICSPFDEPAEHWLIEEGAAPTRLPGRRPSHYFYRAPGADSGAEGAPVGERIELPLVNLIRRRVKQWCEDGWPGVTGTTLELLEYWRRDGRDERKPVLRAARSGRDDRLPDRGAA